MDTQPNLTVIPLEGFWWHKVALYAAHFFVWIGFWLALARAWSTNDWRTMPQTLMLLGVGLLLFRGVAFLINIWVMYAQYISAKEIREAGTIVEEPTGGSILDALLGARTDSK